MVTYRNEKQVLLYKDARHPIESRALSGDKRCAFKTRTVEKIAPHALEPRLCQRLKRHHGPETLALPGQALMDRDQVGKKYDAWTSMAATGSLDVLNDRHPVKLGEFDLLSGAGPGCEEKFFDQVSANGTTFVSGPITDQLMELQHAHIENRYPVSCGNQPRFFAYDGKTYFESKPAAWPPVDNANQYHWVGRINHDKVEDVCGFAFETTISVQTTAP